MDEETKERLVALLTCVGMMAEDLSVIALGAPKLSSEELTDLAEEVERTVMGMLVLGKEAFSVND